jgi:hypothetical protein
MFANTPPTVDARYRFRLHFDGETRLTSCKPLKLEVD